jgi:multiple sugar transport system permease protein
VATAVTTPPQHREKGSLWERGLGRWIRVYIPLAVFILVTLFPFYWMTITSFKSNTELLDTARNPMFVLEPTLYHYQYLLSESHFFQWLLNTTIVAVASTAISLVCSLPAAYALARLRFRGADAIGWGVFITYLVPPTLLFLPLALLIKTFGLSNNLLSLIVTYPTFLIPFATWLLIGYFKGIPRELEESALVDGATRLQAMIRIVMPLALPGILSAGMFAFTLSWGEFLYSLIFISDTQLKTLPVGVVQELIRGDDFFWGQLMAAALLASIPVALLYSFFVEYFVAGMTAGAVKG